MFELWELQFVSPLAPNKLCLCGLPGSGKSTVARNWGWPIISPDWYRYQLYADYTNLRELDPEIEKRVKELVRLEEQGLILQRLDYLDDETNLNPSKIFKPTGYNVFLLRPKVSFLTAAWRNFRRERTVPFKVMLRMRRTWICNRPH